MSACDPGLEEVPTLPSPIAMLAVVESVVYGLVARHAYAEALPAAVPLTLTFIFLVPMAAGYRSVASWDEPRVGVLTPWAAILMVLAAGVAGGGVGLLGVMLLMPVLMLMALLGGALACGVRAVRRAAVRVPHLLAGRNRPRREPRGTWQQILIRTPR